MVRAGLSVLLVLVTAGAAPAEGPYRWPSFRGPDASGHVEGASPPLRWDVPAGEGVRWKTPLPGLSHASPVVWDDRVFVVTAVSEADEEELKVGLYGDVRSVEEQRVHRWKVYALDRLTGEVLWKRTAHEGVPRTRRHPKSTHANPTPASDGEHVVAFFGSEGLYCYTVEGRLLWERDLGVLDAGYFRMPEAQWGFASSPVIHGGRVIVQCDVQGDSFLAAFDVASGEELWRTSRDEVPTWSSPTVHDDGIRPQVIVNGYRHMGGYDLQTGEPLWWMSGGGDIPVPTPVVGEGLVYIANAHGGPAPLYAVRLDAEGDITLGPSETSNEQIAWSDPRSGAYMQTPLVHDGYVYSSRDNGVVTCYEASTGRVFYRERLGDGGVGFSASPVAADDRIYFTSEQGDVHVVRAGPEPQLIARNALGEVAMGTPALAGSMMIFRTRHHVIAVEESR